MLLRPSWFLNPNIERKRMDDEAGRAAAAAVPKEGAPRAMRKGLP